METAAALDATKAAAEGTIIDKDVLRDQIAQVAHPPRPDKTLETKSVALA